MSFERVLIPKSQTHSIALGSESSDTENRRATVRASPLLGPEGKTPMEGSLKTVSDRRLLRGLDDLVAKSRHNDADLLAYLAEVDRRQL